MPPQDQNQYNFILQPNQSSRGPALLQDPKKRKLVAAGFVGSVLIIVLILGMIIFGSSGSDLADIRTLAFRQNQLQILAKNGLENARDTQTKALASTINIVSGSDLQNSTTFLAANNIKISDKDFSLATNNSLTERLESAKQQNNYDQTFNTILSELLAGYRNDLQTSLNNANSTNRRQIVEQAANNLLVIVQE